MSDPEANAPTVLVYGSCVGRDTIEFADSASVDLRGYVARQSLISAGSDASAHLPDLSDVNSQFQARMIRADFSGELFTRLAAVAPDLDVLLWDLADERHGVYRFGDGTYATRSIDTLNVPSVSAVLEQAELIPFGSEEHFSVWRERLAGFKARLLDLRLFEATLVLQIPWALQTTEGAPTPWSMGVRAADANRRYAAYYATIREAGFSVIKLADADVVADPGHRWGLAPFHYRADVYQEVLRQMRARRNSPGFEGRTNDS